MSPNILVTGAAGFIGGSLVATLRSYTNGPIHDGNIIAAVRSEEQVKALSKTGINVIQLDVADQNAVKKAVAENNVDVVVHTAGVSDANTSSNLLKALGEQKRDKGGDKFFIQSSVINLFCADGLWPYGEAKDSDPLFEKDKEIGGPHPARLANILLTELAQELGVTSAIVFIPQVYGTGSGEWRKLSVNIPAHVRASIEDKTVHRFDVEGNPPAVHISDLASLYSLLVEKMLLKAPIPTGEKGYYFAMAHRSPWWPIMDGLAKGLYARGLVTDTNVPVWPSDIVAADTLGFPRMFVRAMTTSTAPTIAENASTHLGWKPQWSEQNYLDSLDDEIQAVLDLDTVKPTAFNAMLAQQK